jgi:tyrosine-protein phosphatase YwqE
MFGSLFGKKKKKEASPSFEGLEPMKVDMHSHLLPGIDDGAQNMEESLAMIERFVGMGYRKLITTPHIMSDFYRNTPEIIMGKLDAVRQEVAKRGWDVQLEAAAEYYLDEDFLDKLKKKEPLLTFGDRYLLFETSYMNANSYLGQAIFMMQSQGYKPVMAHPERYTYWFGKNQEIKEVWEKGVHMQVNLLSLSGYYSKPSKDIAEWLIDQKMVSFVGTDCHRDKHQDALEQVRKLGSYHKLLQLPLLNNRLLEQAARP